MTYRQKENLIALGFFAVLIVIGLLSRPKNSTPAKTDLTSQAATSAPETTQPTDSRIVPFKDIPKLVNKSRPEWIKTLGKPTNTFPPPAWAKNISGTDSWRIGDVHLGLTWNRARLPMNIDLSTGSGTDVLTLEEMNTLASYFGLPSMWEKHLRGLRPFYHWGRDSDPISATGPLDGSAAGDTIGFLINTPGEIPSVR